MVKLFFLLMSLVFAVVYFVPSLVAIGRKHEHTLQITILNAFLGWSFIPWVAALIWATTNHTDEQTSTKGSWIMIGVFTLVLLSPVLLYSMIPAKYKQSVIEESQYKKVIYTTKDGKQIKQETKVESIKKD